MKNNLITRDIKLMLRALYNGIQWNDSCLESMRDTIASWQAKKPVYIKGYGQQVRKIQAETKKFRTLRERLKRELAARKT